MPTDRPSPLPASQRPDAAERNARFLGAGTVAASLIVFAAMTVPPLAGRAYVADDLLAYHLPVRQFYARCLDRGDRFDWMPGLFCGFYLTGEGQGGTYHPVHWLSYRVLPLFAAFHLEVLAPYPFLLLGMCVLLRLQGIRLSVALFGGMLFALSGFNLRHIVHPNAMAVIAHVPWVLACLELSMRTPRQSRWPLAPCGVAVLTASQVLLGYPQYVWFSVLAEISYLLVMHPIRVGRWRTYGELLFVKIVGLCMGAVQIVPTWDALQHSVRSAGESVGRIGNPSYAGRVAGGLHPLNLAQSFAPFLTVRGQSAHECVVYFGSFAVCLVVWLISARLWKSTAHRRLIIWAGGLGIVSAWLAFGDAGGLYSLQRFLPVVGRFRLPARYAVLTALAVSVLSAIALESLLCRFRAEPARCASLRPATIWLPAFSIVVALECALLVPDFANDWRLVLAGPALFAITGAVMQCCSWGQTWAWVCLPVVAACDLGLFGLAGVLGAGTQPVDDLARNVRTPPGEPTAQTRVVVEPQLVPGRRYSFTGNQVLLAGWRKADGYAGLLPRRALLGEATSLPGLRAAGVRWVLRTGRNAEIEGLKPVNENWLEVPSPLPKYRFLSDVRVSDTPAKAIRSVDPAVTVIVEGPLPLEPGAPGTIEAVVDRPGAIDLRVRNRTRQLLVVAESHDPGWTATIDGRPAEVIVVYGQFQGIVVEPGAHRVGLRFRPLSLRVGWWITLGGLITLVVYAVGRCQLTVGS